MKAAEAIRRAAAAIGGRTARLDAELLVADAAGTSREDLLLHPDRDVDERAVSVRVHRRKAGEPVAYILGHQEFWSLDLLVTPDVLIPRPETETLIEAAVRILPRPARILDLGTGSGALVLAALVEFPASTAVATDASLAALNVARRNAQRLGQASRIEFVHTDWAQGVEGGFDLVLCNPPYVALEEELGPGVREYEPHSALFAGDRGLEAYKRILPDLPRLLKPGGHGIFEIGCSQAAAVLEIGERAGLCGEVARDLEGRDRAIIFAMP